MVCAVLLMAISTQSEPQLTKEELATKTKVERIGGQVKWVRENDKWMMSVDIDNPSDKFDVTILKPLTRMAALRIFKGGIDSASWKVLPSFKKLELLVVLSDGVNDNSMLFIGHCEQLQKLDLKSSKLTKVGIESLKRLPRLRRLYLHNAQLDDSALKCLAEFKDLTDLTLSKSVSDTLREFLNHSLPNTRVTQF